MGDNRKGKKQPLWETGYSVNQSVRLRATGRADTLELVLEAVSWVMFVFFQGSTAQDQEGKKHTCTYTHTVGQRGTLWNKESQRLSWVRSKSTWRISFSGVAEPKKMKRSRIKTLNGMNISTHRIRWPLRGETGYICGT